MSQLQSKIASMPAATQANNYDGDINAIQNNISAIYSELDDIRTEMQDVLTDIDDMLAEWEIELEARLAEEEELINAEPVTTTWIPEAWVDYAIPAGEFGQILTDVQVRRIEDEDDYIIILIIYNSYAVDIQPTSITLTFKPDDKVPVSDDTDVYSSNPYLNWNIDIMRTNDQLCKRIQAVADVPKSRLVIPAKVESTPGFIQYRVELSLVY